MLATLDRVQSRLQSAFALGKQTPKFIGHQLESIPTRLPITGFPTLPEHAHRLLNRLPVGARNRIRQGFDHLLAQIPAKKRVRTGEEIFHRFVRLRRSLIQAREHYCHLSDGDLCYWSTRLRDDRPTIVFLHGFADHKDSAYDFAQELYPKYNFLVPDLPGFGKSFRKRDQKYDISHLSAWINEWLDKLGVERVHLIGNSLGGAAAMHLAVDHPERISSLTLVCTAAVIDHQFESLYDELIDGKNLFQIRTLDEFESFMARVFYRNPVVPPFVKDYYFQNFLDNHEWYGELLQNTFGDITSREHAQGSKMFLNEYLHHIQCPTHIIWGEHDRLFPVAFGAKAQTMIKDSKFTVMPGVGHAPQLEKPRDFAKHVHRYLQELKA